MGHLWFVTEIMICYMLTPAIYWAISKMKILTKKIIIIFIFFVIVVQPLLTEWGMQPSYIVTYVLGVFIAQRGLEITRLLFVKLSAMCLGISVLRVVFMNWLDGTNYYDRYFVQISSAVVGIWSVFLTFLDIIREIHVSSKVREESGCFLFE